MKRGKADFAELRVLLQAVALEAAALLQGRLAAFVDFAPPSGSQIKFARTPDGGAPDPLPLPSRATAGAAGLDLRAAIRKPVTIPPGARAMVPTGFAIELPEGYEGQVRPRSGLAWRDGVTVLNAPGTIDADYRGEIAVVLVNLGTEAITLVRGERIAQLVVAPVAAAERGVFNGSVIAPPPSPMATADAPQPTLRCIGPAPRA